MMRECKVVIYDCDGVMFDSFDANLEFYQRIMAMMEKPPLERENEEQMRILHTYSNREVLAHLFHDKKQWQEAIRCAGMIDYRDLVPLMRMEEGFRETLDLLSPRVDLAVCTNRSISMDMVLESFDLSPYFSCVMTAAKVEKPKPHPEPLLKVLEHFLINASDALFVGDSDLDRQSAAAAGVPFIAYKADLPCLARIDRHEDIVNLL